MYVLRNTFLANVFVAAAAISMVLAIDSTSFCQTADVPIAATVANQVISVKQAEALFARTNRERELSEDSKTFLRAKTLEQLVGQLLVDEYLRGAGKLASDDDVQLALERLQGELRSVEQTLEAYLSAQGLSRNELMEQLRFRLSWSRYLEETLTQANLKRHFEKNRRELDGSQVQASHILLKVDDGTAEKAAAVQAQAEQIRKELLAGSITWPDAVQRYSQGASRDAGGELGWIERSTPMPEPFSKAAFALELEQISPPVRTDFGFHLIRCVGLKPGTLTWEQVEPSVRKHATRYLFDWIVTRQTPLSPPKYSGLFPHWDAEAGRVIAATSPSQ